MIARRALLLSVGLPLASSAAVVACSARGQYDNPAEQAVQFHITAARLGDVTALRYTACGKLAAAMNEHSDGEVRNEFIHAYRLGPDYVHAASDPDADTTQQQTVAGVYTRVTDMGVAFVVENHRGWRICEIHRSNGSFGSLPDPFGA